MAKSKHRKGHKQKVEKFRVESKQKQEALRKKMLERYMQMQQEAMANKEAHTSTEEVVPDINVDELVQDWDNVDANIDVDVDVDLDVDVDVNIDNITENLPETENVEEENNADNNK